MALIFSIFLGNFRSFFYLLSLNFTTYKKSWDILELQRLAISSRDNFSLLPRFFCSILTARMSPISVSGCGMLFHLQIHQIDVLLASLAGIVSSMVTLAILPMGLSAAIKIFRHLVLNNV